MNKTDMIDAIATASGESKTTIDRILNAQAEVVHAAAKSGEEITLHGIGKIKINHRPARMGRNPSTGEAMEIAAKKVPAFAAAKALKDAANS